MSTSKAYAKDTKTGEAWGLLEICPKADCRSSTFQCREESKPLNTRQTVVWLETIVTTDMAKVIAKPWSKLIEVLTGFKAVSVAVDQIFEQQQKKL